MGDGNPERRRAPRYPRRMTLKVESTDHGLVELESANIGPGGAYCISPKEFPEMSRLEVTLVLPEAGEPDMPSVPLQIESVVVRSEPAGGSRYHVALFFPRLTDAERDLLDRYLPAAQA